EFVQSLFRRLGNATTRFHDVRCRIGHVSSPLKTAFTGSSAATARRVWVACASLWQDTTMIQNVLVEALAIGHALWMYWMRRSRRILDKIGQCVALGHPSRASGTAECNGSGVCGLKGMLGTNRPVAPGASLQEMACGERNIARLDLQHNQDRGQRLPRPVRNPAALDDPVERSAINARRFGNRLYWGFAAFPTTVGRRIAEPCQRSDDIGWAH